MGSSRFNRRLIAVDDDPLILALYRKIFSSNEESEAMVPSEALGETSQAEEGGQQRYDMRYQLTCHDRGEEMVEAVRASLLNGQPYAVALVDMRMPNGMDGLEVGRKVRALDPALQIVFVTAYRSHGIDRIVSEVGGAVLWFRKPIQSEELVQAVRNCCISWNQADELQRLKNNLLAQVELQTTKLEARIEEMELLQKNAVEREQKMELLKRELNRYKPWRDLKRKLVLDTDSAPYSQSLPLHSQEGGILLLLIAPQVNCSAEWEEALATTGFGVTVVNSVEQGLEQMRAGAADVLLIDSAVGRESTLALLDHLVVADLSSLPLLLLHDEDRAWSGEAAVLHQLPVAEGIELFQRRMRSVFESLSLQQQDSDVLVAEKKGEDVAINRVLLVDDEQVSLDALSNLLSGSDPQAEFELGQLAGLVYGTDQQERHQPLFEIHTCLQGEEAVDFALQAEREGRPFVLAIVDMRMPPGIDGLETAYQLRKISPEIEIVVLSAYSDYSLEDIQQVLGQEFSFANKPFQSEEMLQRAVEGCAKWNLRKQADKGRRALLNLAEDMEQEIEQRKEAEQQLIEANRAKDDFFSNMSHELRTPLTTMIGYTEVIVEEEHISERIREMAQSGMLAGKTLLQLVNDILDFSKLRSGKFELNYGPFDLRKLLEDVSGLMQVYGSEQGITVILEIAPELEEALQTQWIGDETRISQILYNLLSNAVKFSKLDGKVILRLDHASDDGTQKEQNERFAITVRDHGIGMSADACARIFNPYEQADQTISGRYGGTGLGLFITQQLTEMMQGTVAVESREGEGATFTVTLPFERTQQRVEQSESGVNGVAIPALQGRVLLAEDTIQLQRLTTMLIGKTGAEVEIANNRGDSSSASVGLYHTGGGTDG